MKCWSQQVERYWVERKTAQDTQVLNFLLEKSLKSYHPSKILEVGCGPGIFTPKLSERAWVVALDISVKMLKFVKARNVCVELVQADIESLPFRDKSFDMIVAYRVVEYSGDDKETLRKFSRIAQIVLLQLPRLDSIRGLLLSFLRMIGVLLKRTVRFRSYSVKAAMKMVDSVGLSLVEAVLYNHGLDIHMALVKNLMDIEAPQRS
ncbi:MAG: class I SAM-dependent methyltransferase [Nitrososphaerales archaeon]|nr:class I SAM-dependent methyltransferase [Nitrososphaerales archaeon]